MSARIDLAAAIDARPLGWFQIRIALLCAAILLLESFDSTVLGYVAPALSTAWRLAPGALGPVFAAGFLGQLIGAVLAGPLADRVGRKPILVAAVIGFGLGALATTRAASFDALLAIRLATGLGLGAALPNAVALTTEISPAARRSVLLVLVFCGITVGAAGAGAAAARLLPAHGWQSPFWLGGLAPLALVPALVTGLSESPYLLALRGGRDATIASILRRMGPGPAVEPGTRFFLAEERAPGLSVGHLFRHGRATATLLLWLIVFMNNLEIYVFASWLPSLAVASGLSQEAGVMTGVAMTLGGFGGTLVMGWLLDRFAIERMMAVTYAAAGGFLALLAVIAGDRWPMSFAATAAGFCLIGGQTGANALIAYRHPTYIRATALAWALGAGRVASIFGPLGAGWVISLGWSSRSTFLLAVLPALCAAAAVLWLGERAKRPTAADAPPTPASAFERIP